MRYLIAAATAVALVVGIAIGFALTATVFEADAAKPVKPPQEGRLIELGTLTANPSERVGFPLVNTSDCSQVSAVAAGSSVNIDTSLLSLDGTTLSTFDPHAGLGGGPISTASLAPWPFIQFRVQNTSNSLSTDIAAWLWCAP